MGDHMTKNKFFKILALFVLLAALAWCVWAAVGTPENSAVASLGRKYKKETVIDEGFTDRLILIKYTYRQTIIGDDFALTQLTPEVQERLLAYIDNFEEHLSADEDNAAKYRTAFSRDSISSDDYVLIADSSWGDQGYSDYDLYYFDVQSKVLYYFHFDI